MVRLVLALVRPLLEEYLKGLYCWQSCFRFRCSTSAFGCRGCSRCNVELACSWSSCRRARATTRSCSRNSLYWHWYLSPVRISRKRRRENGFPGYDPPESGLPKSRTDYQGSRMTLLLRNHQTILSHTRTDTALVNKIPIKSFIIYRLKAACFSANTPGI